MFFLFLSFLCVFLFPFPSVWGTTEGGFYKNSTVCASGDPALIFPCVPLTNPSLSNQYCCQRPLGSGWGCNFKSPSDDGSNQGAPNDCPNPTICGCYSPSSSAPSLSAGAITGIVIGSVVGFILIVYCLIMLCVNWDGCCEILNSLCCECSCLKSCYSCLCGLCVSSSSPPPIKPSNPPISVISLSEFDSPPPSAPLSSAPSNDSYIRPPSENPNESNESPHPPGTQSTGFSVIVKNSSQVPPSNSNGFTLASASPFTNDIEGNPPKYEEQ